LQPGCCRSYAKSSTRPLQPSARLRPSRGRLKFGSLRNVPHLTYNGLGSSNCASICITVFRTCPGQEQII
jgi:hypothetical protein